MGQLASGSVGRWVVGQCVGWPCFSLPAPPPGLSLRRSLSVGLDRSVVGRGRQLGERGGGAATCALERAGFDVSYAASVYLAIFRAPLILLFLENACGAGRLKQLAGWLEPPKQQMPIHTGTRGFCGG